MIQNPLDQSLNIVERLPSTMKEAISGGTIVLKYVEMGRWAYTTTDEYLFTHGAGPCLNIVVHNWSAHGHGALAHVTYADIFDQQMLFDRAADVTLLMVQACQINPADRFEIWLGAGYGYHHSNPGQTNTEPGRRLVPFILDVLEGHTINQARIRVSTDHFLALVDGQVPCPDPDPGDIIYHPSSRQVILLGKRAGGETDDVSFVVQSGNAEGHRPEHLAQIPGQPFGRI